MAKPINNNFTTERENLLKGIHQMGKKMKFIDTATASQELEVEDVDQEALSLEIRLFLQVMMASKDQVRRLLKVGADANYKINGISPLELAKVYGHQDIIELFEEYGFTPKKIKPSKK